MEKSATQTTSLIRVEEITQEPAVVTEMKEYVSSVNEFAQKAMQRLGELSETDDRKAAELRLEVKRERTKITNQFIAGKRKEIEEKMRPLTMQDEAYMKLSKAVNLIFKKIESECEEIEKSEERRKALELENRTLKRRQQLNEIGNPIVTVSELETMTDGVWDVFYQSKKKEHEEVQSRIEEQRLKAEADAKRAKELRALHEERLRAIAPMSNIATMLRPELDWKHLGEVEDWDALFEQCKAEKERYRVEEEERRKAEEERIAKERAEAAQKAKEAEEHRKKIELAQKRVNELWMNFQKKIEIDQVAEMDNDQYRELYESLQREKKEQEKIALEEMLAKKKAEEAEKERLREEARKAAEKAEEEKRKDAARKEKQRLEMLPDKQRLEEFAKAVEALPFPRYQSESSSILFENVQAAQKKFVNWIRAEINKI
jgi:hypothetical protein